MSKEFPITNEMSYKTLKLEDVAKWVKDNLNDEEKEEFNNWFYWSSKDIEKKDENKKRETPSWLIAKPQFCSKYAKSLIKKNKSTTKDILDDILK